MTALCGLFCVASALAGDWALEPPKSQSNVWSTIIPLLKLEKATSRDVMSTLQTEMRCLGQTGVVFRLPPVADGPRLSLTATNISALESLRIAVGDPLFHQQRPEVVVPDSRCHWDGSANIHLRGTCVDETTGEGISRFTIDTVRIPMMFDDPKPERFTVTTSTNGVFMLLMPIAAYGSDAHLGEFRIQTSCHAQPQAIALTATAPGYQPAFYTLHLDTSNLTYKVDFKMKKRSSNHPSEGTR